jgi:hypothetical protein
MRDNPNRPLRLLGAASMLVVLGCSLVLDKTKVPAHAAPLAGECALV